MKFFIFDLYTILVDFFKQIFKLINWLSVKVFIFLILWGIYSLILNSGYKFKLLSLNDFIFYTTISIFSIYMFKSIFNGIKNYEATQEKALAFANFILNFIIGPLVIALIWILLSNLVSYFN